MADEKYVDFHKEPSREHGKPTNNEATSHRHVQPKVGQVRASKRSMLEHRKPSCRTRRSQKSDRREKGVNSSATGILSNTSVVCKVDCDDGAIPIPLSSSKHLTSSSLSCPNSTISNPVNNTGETSEHKRPRPGVDLPLVSDTSASAPPNCCDITSHTSDKFASRGIHSSESRAQFSCEYTLLDEMQLHSLLSRESDYHPNNAFLYYVDPELEDKVDAGLRNDAIHNLRFMHNACFNLSTDTFCKAVNLIDRFIVKVKVKPKYIACVAAACYCAASKLTYLKTEGVDLPSPEALVQITRCGGNASDLLRMEEILRSKLCHDMNGVNAFDFLRVFADCLMNNEADLGENECSSDSSRDNKQCSVHQQQHHICTGISSYQSTRKDNAFKRILLRRTQLNKRLATFMEIALCHLEVYRFRPACLALGILAQCDIDDLLPLANICEIDWVDVCNCADLVERLYNRNLLPRHRRQFAYTSSRRTLFRIGYSCPTPLDTISEDNEPGDEDEWLLPSLFEP